MGMLAPLFANHRQLRAVLDAALEGRLGQTVTDSASKPGAARLDVGCYSFFGGDPRTSSASELVAKVAAPRELLYPDSQWRALLLQVHGDRLRDRPMQAFSADSLNPNHLLELTRRLPETYTLRQLDAEGARQLGAEFVPHALQTYADADDFAAHGLGFGAFIGDRLACAATSYTLASSRLELAISTHPDHRGCGLATATAARLALECLQRDLEPCWNASNPVSQRLAGRLGFRPAGVCEILFLE